MDYWVSFSASEYDEYTAGLWDTFESAPGGGGGNAPTNIVGAGVYGLVNAGSFGP